MREATITASHSGLVSPNHPKKSIIQSQSLRRHEFIPARPSFLVFGSVRRSLLHTWPKTNKRGPQIGGQCVKNEDETINKKQINDRQPLESNRSHKQSSRHKFRISSLIIMIMIIRHHPIQIPEQTSSRAQVYRLRIPSIDSFIKSSILNHQSSSLHLLRTPLRRTRPRLHL